MKDDGEHINIIMPALLGTKNVMRAATLNRVKRVVMTSSISAIRHKISDQNQLHFTPQDWSDLEACSNNALHKSKIMAERAAWESYKAQGENED